MEQLYAPKGKFLWDFWIVKYKNLYHIFYLEAPRTLENPEIRHDVSSVGHATSNNLIEWKEQSTILRAGSKGQWDDLCIWTGGIIRKDSKFYMLYTGRSIEHENIQRIGLAFSDNLYEWIKYGNNPVIEADSRWYLMDENLSPSECAWRDPFLYYDRNKSLYYALITATDRRLSSKYNGCIGIASSKDLFKWKVMPPVCSPGYYTEMECPQIIYRKKKYYLLFSTWEKCYSDEWSSRVGGAQTGLHAFFSGRIDGDYLPVGNGVIVGSESNFYGTHVIKDPDNNDVALSWVIKTEKETFSGRLSLPVKVIFNVDSINVHY